jgi:radical SAM protein with 4Fe4S-binding SPASM domain
MARRFWKVNIEISNICNLQCSFCPEVIRPKALMPPAFFDQIAHQVAPFTNTVALHLMGDPLVHPELKEILDCCQRHHLQVFFVTNGLLLGEKQLQLLLHPSLRQVSFSLHSFYDNFPDRDPATYLQRIFDFTAQARLQHPRLFINYRLWNLQSARGGGDKNRDILERIEAHFGVQLPEVDIRIQKKVPIQSYVSLHFDEEFTWPGLHLPPLHDQGTCQGLSSHFGVLVDGTVVPCCLDKEGGIALGNLKNETLGAILESDRARAVWRGFKRGELVEDLCKRCQYIERFSDAALSKRAKTEAAPPATP